MARVLKLQCLHPSYLTLACHWAPKHRTVWKPFADLSKPWIKIYYSPYVLFIFCQICVLSSWGLNSSIQSAMESNRHFCAGWLKNIFAKNFSHTDGWYFFRYRISVIGNMLASKPFWYIWGMCAVARFSFMQRNRTWTGPVANVSLCSAILKVKQRISPLHTHQHQPTWFHIISLQMRIDHIDQRSALQYRRNLCLSRHLETEDAILSFLRFASIESTLFRNRLEIISNARYSVTMNAIFEVIK